MDTNNSTVFWVNKPKILFKKNLITEISFNNNMSLEEKLNALTRFIILVSYWIHFIKTDKYNTFRRNIYFFNCFILFLLK